MINVAALVMACSCATPDLVFPAEGTTNVPLNVVLRGMFWSEVRADQLRLLRDADRVDVPFTRNTVGRITTFTPVQKLEPSTAYRIVLAGDPSDGITQVFTTGTNEDLREPADPTLPGVDYSYTVARDECGEQRMWQANIAGTIDTFTPQKDLIVLAYAGDATEPADVIGMASLGSSYFFNGHCPDNIIAPVTESFDLRVQIVDLAGNASGLSAAKNTFGAKSPGCAAVPGEMLLLLALLLRRRT